MEKPIENLFKSYTEIEQDRKKYIEEVLIQNPELETETFSIQEKLDGSNIQFIFTPNEKLHIASKTHILEENEKFYDIFNVIEKYLNMQNSNLQNIFDYFYSLSKQKQNVIRLYGELYGGKARGSGINPLAKNKQIRYSSEKMISFFDMVINDEYLPTKIVREYFEKLNSLSYLAPQLAIIKGFQNALNFDINIPSRINPVEGNLIEGIVIKSYNKVYYNKYNRIIYIKKKNSMFLERHTNRIKKEIPENIKEYQEIFKEYLTQTRVNTIISKFGEIKSKKEIGKYIQYVLQDAKKDFIKDYPKVESELNKSGIKMILKCKNEIVNWLLDTVPVTKD